MPKGNPHEDKDREFSRTSERLNYNDALTLEHLREQLHQTYNDITRVSHTKRVFNWSSLCKQERFFQRVTLLSLYQYYWFPQNGHDRSGATGTQEVANNRFCVKVEAGDEWVPLKTPGGDRWKGFLNVLQDLKNTPGTVISCPSGADDVTKGILLEEGRINETA